MPLFKKKPVTIEAHRFEGDNAELHSIMSWMEKNLWVFLVGDATKPETLRYPDQLATDDSKPDKGIYIDPEDGMLVIRTLEGDMKVSLGDWIIKGAHGEFYPCKPDIFDQTYDFIGPREYRDAPYMVN